jgi:hypothetical protein
MGPVVRKIHFRTPPPPLIKDRIPRGVRKSPRSVDLRAGFLTADLCSLFNTNLGPPPPPLKAERWGGVRHSLWIIDLSAPLRAVQICARIITYIGPPPPSIKGRTEGGGPISNVNRGLARSLLDRPDMCKSYR